MMRVTRTDFLGLDKMSYDELEEFASELADYNAELRELFNETLARLAAANEAAGGGFMDARYCELLESHGIEVDA